MLYCNIEKIYIRFICETFIEKVSQPSCLGECHNLMIEINN